MESFLKRCAKALKEKKLQNIQTTVVILPTKRSVTIFKKRLLKHALQPAAVISFDEFIVQMAGRKPSGMMPLLLELYDVFKKIQPETQLDKFMAWGITLLKDFDLIDKNLIDDKMLFSLLKDIQDINRWGLEDKDITDRIKRYFALWESLHDVYQQYTQYLHQTEQAYEGLLYREIAENCQKYLIEKSPYDFYVFIGFNALSKAEEEIFKFLQKQKKALFFWDTDRAYFDKTSENKAGLFLKKYKNSWAGEDWNFEENFWAESPKEIQTIQVSNASMQGRVANQLLKNWEISPTSTARTVIILADEGILLSVLHALNDSYSGLNITMGVSMRHSSLFNWLELFFELHTQTKRSVFDSNLSQKIPKFYYQSLIKILAHPFVREYEQLQIETLLQNKDYATVEELSFLQMLVQLIHKNNLFYLSEEEIYQIVNLPAFQENLSTETVAYFQELSQQLQGFLNLLLSSWRGLEQLIQKLLQLTEIIPPKPTALHEEHSLRFREILEDFATMLRMLKKRKPHLRKEVNKQTFKSFLYQALREENITFDSDRESPLQIMGLLESRTLDFDNIIFLSVNEKYLPKNRKNNSFIPHDVAQKFQLPTHNEQEAVISYHFYRVLQRAKKIALVYVAPSDTYGGGEKSRFIYQLEDDWGRKNPQISFKHQVAKFEQGDELPPIELKIEKTPALLKRLKQQFKEGITPSHLNTFIICSIKYYFSHLAELRESSQADEDLGADKFGVIVHEILENLFREMATTEGIVTKNAIQEKLPEVRNIVTEKFLQSQYALYSLTGVNYLTKEVAITFVQNFLEAQLEEMGESHFEIVILENQDVEDQRKSFSPTFRTQFDWEYGQEKIPVQIAGIIDRIDKIAGQTRIIDYKTGTVNERDFKLKESELERLATDPDLEKLRQLWIYKYILAKNIAQEGALQLGHHTLSEKEPLIVGVYALKEPKKFLISIKDEKNQENKLFAESPLPEFIAFSEKHIQAILQEMLNTQTFFERTEDVDKCSYCSFKAICGRD